MGRIEPIAIYEELERTSKATPDQCSERFGLREEAQPALERAHYFMTWGEQPEFEPKETVLMQMEITRAGFEGTHQQRSTVEVEAGAVSTIWPLGE